MSKKEKVLKGKEKFLGMGYIELEDKGNDVSTLYKKFENGNMRIMQFEDGVDDSGTGIHLTKNQFEELLNGKPNSTVNEQESDANDTLQILVQTTLTTQGTKFTALCDFDKKTEEDFAYSTFSLKETLLMVKNI